MLHFFAETPPQRPLFSEQTGLGTLDAVVVFAFLIAGFLLLAFTLFLSMRFFEKAGQAGWKALIPIYNMVIFLRLGGFSGWWIAVNLLPGLGSLIFLVILILAAHKITLNFGKPGWYVVFY